MSGTDIAVADSVTTDPPTQTPPTGAAPMLSQGKWAGIIALIAMITVALCVLGAVGAMVYRVIMDGNSPVTADISGKLTMIGLGGIGALILALFGSNSLISKLMEKLL